MSPSAKPPGGEDLDIEEPVACRYASAFHFHPILAGMPSPTLIRDQVVQVGEPCEKRLLTAPGMMEALHRKELPLEGVMRLIQQGAGYGHLWGCEDHIPAGFLLVKP